MRKMMIAGLAALWAGAVLAADAPKKTDEKKPEAPAAAPAEAAVSLARAALCTGVADREPVGSLEKEPYEFKADAGSAFLFVEAKTKTPPQALTVVWSADGKEAASVTLNVKNERARTWSSKKVWTGKWKVEVKDSSGAALKTLEFTVGK